MSDPGQPCWQFRQIDLAAYLVEPERPEWSAFKAHFATCEECSGALRGWSEIEWELAASGSVHPDVEALDFYSTGIGLDHAERTRIESHLAGCPPCADQLRALEAFAPLQPSSASVRDASSPADSLWERLRGWLESWGTAPAPALAMALVVVLGAWLVLSSEGGPILEETPPTIAERDARGPTEEADRDAVPRQEAEGIRIPPRPGGLAEVDPPREIEDDASSPPQLADTKPPTTPSGGEPPQARDRIAVDAQDATPNVDAPETSGQGEILIAALDWSGGLDYIAPRGGVGRLDLVGRGASDAPANPIQLVAPASHSGRVVSPTPTLLWALRADESRAIEIQIVDERAIDPALRLRLEGPHEAGLHGIDLAEFSLRLDPGVPYVWSAAVVIDEQSPARNPRSQATIVSALADVVDPAALHAGSATERIEAAFRAGLWYDGMGELARVAAARPGEAATSAVLGDLLSGESLPRAAAENVILHRPTASTAR